MWNRNLLLIVVVLFAVVLSACAQSPTIGTETSAATPLANMDHAAADASQPIDAQFIDSMIEHHQGVIDMAEAALGQAEHEELRTLSEKIVAAQTTEIEQMQSWRSEWYPDLPPTGGMEMGMGDMMISEVESVPFNQ